MVTEIFFTISESMHERERKSTKDLVAKYLFLDYILNVEFIFLKKKIHCETLVLRPPTPLPINFRCLIREKFSIALCRVIAVSTLS